MAGYLRKSKRSPMKAFELSFSSCKPKVSCFGGKSRIWRGFVGSHLCCEDLGLSEPKVSLPTGEHIVFYCNQRSFLDGTMGRAGTNNSSFGHGEGCGEVKTNKVDTRQGDLVIFAET